MKKTFMTYVPSFLAICLLTASAARATDAPPPDLGDVMDDMNAGVKAISAQMNDPKSNADSAKKAEDLRANILKALPLIPPKIDSLTDKDSKSTETIAYLKGMAQLYATASDLEIAFLKGDNTAANAAFAQLGAQKKAGHDRFKEQTP